MRLHSAPFSLEAHKTAKPDGRVTFDAVFVRREKEKGGKIVCGRVGWRNLAVEGCAGAKRSVPSVLRVWWLDEWSVKEESSGGTY